MVDWNAEEVAEHLRERLGEYLKDLEELVNIDSGTFDKAGVDRVGACLMDRYARLGAAIELYPDPAFGDTYLARFSGRGSGTALLLGHTDTVYSPGTAAARPFHVDGDRAYGPGVADMKSGDLCIGYAIEALRAQSFDDFRQITVIHNSDEEVGSPTSRDLIRHEAEDADVVYVLEAGRQNGNIVSARKGIADCRIRVVGRSAHAGVNRDLGRSAALELAHLIVALEGINGMLPGVTVNVGRVEAGERPNVVPDRGFAHFEIRAFERATLERALLMVEEAVARRTVPDTTVELETRVEHYPMHKSPETARLVVVAQQLAEQLGMNLSDTATGGASDGNTAAAAGRPVLDGLGPVGGAAHSPDEYLLVPSIIPRTALLSGLIAVAVTGAW